MALQRLSALLDAVGWRLQSSRDRKSARYSDRQLSALWRVEAKHDMALLGPSPKMFSIWGLSAD
jgi:hypothetical protein